MGKSRRQKYHDEWKNDIKNRQNEQNATKWVNDMKNLIDRFNSQSQSKIPIVNGEFSDPVQDPRPPSMKRERGRVITGPANSSYSYKTPTGWTKGGNGNIVLSNGAGSGFDSFGPYDKIKQFMGFQLIEGWDVHVKQTIKFPSTGVYRVTFALAARRYSDKTWVWMNGEHRVEVGIDLDGGQYYEHAIPSRNWTVFEDYFFIRDDFVNKPAEFKIRSFGARGSDSTAYIAKVSIIKTSKCPYFSDSTDLSNPTATKPRTMFDPRITNYNSRGEIWDSIERGDYNPADPKNVAKFRPINTDSQDSTHNNFMNPYPDTKDNIAVDCLNEWTLKRAGYEYCNANKTSVKKTGKKSSVFDGNTDTDHLNHLTNLSDCIPVNPYHYGITRPIFKDPSGHCEVLGTDIEKKNQIFQSMPITNVFSHNQFAFVKPKCVKVNASNEVVLSQCEEKTDTPLDVQLHSIRRIYTVKNPNDFYRERIAPEGNTYRIVRFEGLNGKGCLYTDQDKVKYDPSCSNPNNENRLFYYDPSNNVFSQTTQTHGKRYMTAAGLMNQAHDKLKAKPGNPDVVGDIPMTMADCTSGIQCDNIPLNTVDLFNDENKINIGDQMYRFATDPDFNPNIIEPTAYLNLLSKYEEYVKSEKIKYEKAKQDATFSLQKSEENKRYEEENEGKIKNQNQYVIQESYHKILQQSESIRTNDAKETTDSQVDRKRTFYKMNHQKSGRFAHQILFILYFVTMGLFLITLFLKTEMTFLWIPIVLVVVLFPFWVLFIEYTLGYILYYVYYFLKGSPSYNVPFNSSFVPAFFYQIYYNLFGKPVLHEEINMDYYTAFYSHGIIPFM